MSIDPEVRKQRRLIAIELLTRAQPSFDPVRELFECPLYQLKDTPTLAKLLKSECDRQIGIFITPSEAEIMLMIASGLSMDAIAAQRASNHWTVISQRKTLMHKFRACYPQLAFDNGSKNKRTSQYEQNSFIAIITHRLLNQTI